MASASSWVIVVDAESRSSSTLAAGTESGSTLTSARRARSTCSAVAERPPSTNTVPVSASSTAAAPTACITPAGRDVVAPGAGAPSVPGSQARSRSTSERGAGVRAVMSRTNGQSTTRPARIPTFVPNSPLWVETISAADTAIPVP